MRAPCKGETRCAHTVLASVRELVMVAVRQALSPPHHFAGHRKGFPAPRGPQTLNHSDCPCLGSNWPPQNPLKSAQSSGTWKRLQNSHPISSHINDSYKHKHTSVSSPSFPIPPSSQEALLPLLFL